MEARDGYVQVAGYRPKALDALKERLGVDEVTIEVVREMVKGMTRDEALRYFVELGMPVALVYQVNECMEDPHLKERGRFFHLEHPRAGRYRTVSFPVKFSEIQPVERSATPLVGQHNREVLEGLLGYDSSRVEKLEKGGVIYTDK